MAKSDVIDFINKIDLAPVIKGFQRKAVRSVYTVFGLRGTPSALPSFVVLPVLPFPVVVGVFLPLLPTFGVLTTGSFLPSARVAISVVRDAFMVLTFQKIIPQQ
jgi:hypothetical protein